MPITLHGTNGIDSPDFNATGSVVPANGMYLPATNTLAWATNSTRNMTLNSSGNLGIGTSSPAYALDIYSTGAASAVRIIGAGSSSLYSYSDSGGVGWTSAAPYTSGVLYYQTSNTHIWYVGSTERARIDASGNLLVGTTTSSLSSGIGVRALGTGQLGTALAGSTNAADTLDVYSTGASAYRFYVGMAGNVYATSTTITAISDQRLKENIVDLDAGLAEILALKPRRFDWKEGKGKGIKNDRGFIAQEFEQVFPDLIDTWKDEPPEGEEPYKAVRPDLIPVIVKAIQELTKRLEALEAK